MQLDFILNPEYANTVFAYIDPGTGSLLIQFAIGFLIAIGATVKIYWGRIKSIINKADIKEDSDV